MPEIGATLRSARERSGLDIADVESATKIRAKYLRALEDEEWELLPGPTYVKSFLRTYAEALGLDARLLVDEYKVRHERLSDQELRPISPPRAGKPGRGGSRRAGGAGGPGGGGGSRLGRDILVALLVVGLVAALIALGRSRGDDDDATVPTGGATTTTPAATTPRRSTTTRRRAARPRTVRLQVVPTGEVFVCLRDRRRGAIIDGVTLNAGEAQPTYSSSRFVIGLGNNAVRLRINGRTRAVPASDGPVGYAITPTRTTRLRGDAIPDCAA